MAIVPSRGRTTDPRLLERVRDWQDHEAWYRFVAHYEPHLRAVGRRYGFVGEGADECCQYVWEKLATEMRRFRYDPGQRFRGWLHGFFGNRVRDFRKIFKAHVLVLEEPLIAGLASGAIDSDDVDEPPRDPLILAMLSRAEAVQGSVRARVTADNWEAFRMIAIEGFPVAEVAKLLDREYAAVFRAYKRVCRMIDAERCRLENTP
jgi:RNA polymerase sigma-70 factor (ECF subfamily)